MPGMPVDLVNDLLEAADALAHNRIDSSDVPWPLIVRDRTDVVRIDPEDLSEDSLEDREDVAAQDRFISALAALFENLHDADAATGLDKGKLQQEIERIDEVVEAQLTEILHAPKFQQVESTWRGLYEFVSKVNFLDNVMVDVIDVTWKELYDDLTATEVDIQSGSLFKKIYIAEYDQYGGKPYGSMIGMYSLGSTPAELKWLQLLGRVANAAHAPLITSASPAFFGCDTIQQLAAIRNLETHLDHPNYSGWHALRDTPEAAYIGLALPRYLMRKPYHPKTNPAMGLPFDYSERIRNGQLDPETGLPLEDEDYLWGNPAMLVAQNMDRSFETSRWCQYIRGPQGGGLITGMVTHTFNVRGEEETKIPVEMQIPDFREFEFAKSGFMPLVYKKGTGEACFFSCQSAKVPKRFVDPQDSENSQLVCNLSYTLSITRLAHYIKSIMRDKIGSTADGAYIQKFLTDWITGYVTTVVSPDDLTLRYYPFKAALVEVLERAGEIGWYDCKVAVKPHIQFEGMDVELRLETRL